MRENYLKYIMLAIQGVFKKKKKTTGVSDLYLKFFKVKNMFEWLGLYIVNFLNAIYYIF